MSEVYTPGRFSRWRYIELNYCIAGARFITVQFLDWSVLPYRRDWATAYELDAYRLGWGEPVATWSRATAWQKPVALPLTRPLMSPVASPPRREDQ